MPLLNRTLPALALLGTLTLTACDTGGPDTPPQPQTATVTLDVLSASAAGDCDARSNPGSNPGDYQFRVEVLDAGNGTIDQIDLPTIADYGVHVGDDDYFVQLVGGQTATFNNVGVTFQRPMDPTGTFGISASAVEWDSATEIDGQMNNVTASQSHAYANGQFENVVGTQSLRLRGSEHCDVTLRYRISVQ